MEVLTPVQKIMAVARTLERIDIHGKTNMETLLACINTLDAIAQDLNKAEGDAT